MSGLVKISGLVAMLVFSGDGFGQGNVELGQIQRVYLMPMTGSFDHYLANRLRSIGSIRVVTDPTKADAYFTDRLGAAFEERLREFDEKAVEESKEKPEPGSDEALKLEAEKAFKLAPKIMGSIGRGKGTIFLVERRTRNIVWSIYEKPKDMQPKTLDKTAEKVAEELKKELGGGK